MTQELKSLKIEEVKIADAIEVSNNALASTNDQIKRAQQMIKRANFLLSKAELVRVVKTA